MEILVQPIPVEARYCDEDGGCGSDACWMMICELLAGM